MAASEKTIIKKKRAKRSHRFQQEEYQPEDQKAAQEKKRQRGRKEKQTKQDEAGLITIDAQRLGCQQNPARIYVGKYKPGQPLPAAPAGSRNILIHLDPKPLGGALSPYCLQDEQGRLLENLWQFSKVYPSVSAQRIPVSRWRPHSLVWEHPAETHVDPSSGSLLPSYWAWRSKGMANPAAVRYPNGFHGRSRCLYSLWPIDSSEDPPLVEGSHGTTEVEQNETTEQNEVVKESEGTGGQDVVVGPEGLCYRRLNYLQARKVIYCGLYARLAQRHPQFVQLKQMLENGQVLQLLEVDGPNTEWYTDSPIATSIAGPYSLAISPDTIHYLLNDPRHPFGHGYVLAALLLDQAHVITAI